MYEKTTPENEKAASSSKSETASIQNTDATQYSRKVKPDTKLHTILSTFVSGRSLNRFEAIRLHETALNSTIPVLQEMGLFIARAWEKVPCVNGTKTTKCLRYSLPESEMPKARRLLGLPEVEATA